MAYEIEGFSGPLLAQAKAKTKKLEKQAKKQNLYLLGVQAANYTLRNKAQKRAEDWYAGSEPILRQAKRNAQTGFNFWRDHNSMVGEKYDPSDWRAARAEQLFEGELTTSGYNLKPEEKAAALSNYMVSIEDELDAYGERMELHSQFKGGFDQDTKTAIRDSYYGNIERMLAQERSSIEEDSTIFKSVMRAVGVGRAGELDDVDVRNLARPEDLSPAEDEILSFFDRAKERQTKAEELRGRSARPDLREDFSVSRFITNDQASAQDVFERPVAMSQRAFLRENMSDAEGLNQITKKYGEGNFQVTLRDEVNSEDTYDLSLGKVINMLSDDVVEGKNRTERAEFIDNVTTLASILEYKFVQAAEVADTRLDTEMMLPEAEAFMQGAFQLLAIGDGEDSNIKYKKVKFGRDGITYKPLGSLELTLLANTANEMLPEGVYSELFGDINLMRGNQEQLRNLIEEEEANTAATIATGGAPGLENKSQEEMQDVINESYNDPDSDLTQLRPVVEAWADNNEGGDTLRAGLERAIADRAKNREDPAPVDIDLSEVSSEGVSDAWLDNIGVNWREDLPGASILGKLPPPPLTSSTDKSYATITLKGLTRDSSIEDIREHLEQIILSDTTPLFSKKDAEIRLAQLNERY